MANAFNDVRNYATNAHRRVTLPPYLVLRQPGAQGVVCMAVATWYEAAGKRDLNTC
jgi:hypothetical protein